VWPTGCGGHGAQQLGHAMAPNKLQWQAAGMR